MNIIRGQHHYEIMSSIILQTQESMKPHKTAIIAYKSIIKTIHYLVMNHKLLSIMICSHINEA